MNRYRIESVRSRFTVQAIAAGLLSAFAHSPIFSVRDLGGEARLGATADRFEIELTIEAVSLELEGPIRDADRREMESRMRDEVLEVSAFREVAYRGRALRAETIGQGRFRLLIVGELDLHGVVRPHQVDADLVVYSDGIRLGGTGRLRMSDHGIRPVKALGGAIRLKDELTMSFDLAATPVES